MSERREYKRFEILGIQDDELVCLSEITNVTCCGEKSGQIHTITMRALTEETIENQKDPENLRDLWIEAVKGGYTDDGLEDWVEDACAEAEGNDQYFPFDDDSYRSDTNYALENLPEKEREKITEYFEKLCEDDYTTFKDFECSCCGHYDSCQMGKPFSFKTKFGKKFIPLFDDFVKGEIDYDTLVNEIVKYENDED